VKRLGLMTLLFFCIEFTNVHAEALHYKGIVTSESTTLQDETGTNVGTIFEGTEIIYQPYNEQYIKVIFNKKALFIDVQSIEMLEEVSLSDPISYIGQVKTESTYTLHKDPSTDSAILFTGSTEEILSVSSIVNGFFEIQFGGKSVYLSNNQANAVFGEFQAFDVISNEIPLYEMINGQLSHKGTLSKNTAWKISRQTIKYHVLKVGSKEYFVSKQHTFPSMKNPSVLVPRSAKYPLSLTTERVTPIFTKDGRIIGNLNKGNLVHIKGIDGKKAIINFYGKDARVYFNHLVHSNAIQPKQSLSHLETSYYMQVFAFMYPEFMELKTIGKSVEGREIHALRLGKGKKEVLMDGSLHAREHMTTNVLLEMVDTYSYHYLNNSIFEGYSSRSILNNVSIWFVPMVNPDGVTLVQEGVSRVKNGDLATKINKGSTNFQAWKANIRGVDLNDNFDSDWERITSSVTTPSPSGYRGPRVYSEPESQALRDFIDSRNFKGYYSYHSSGQIIYWFNFQKGEQATRDINLAQKVSSLTGYRLVSPMYLVGSGASTDWFIEKTKMPGFVIEISPYVGNRPVPLTTWDIIWKQNRKVGLYLAKDANSR